MQTMNPIQTIFINVLGIWVLLFGLSVLGGRGERFARWSWDFFFARPIKAFWRHFGFSIQLLLAGLIIGLILGAQNAPAINQFLGH